MMACQLVCVELNILKGCVADMSWWGLSKRVACLLVSVDNRNQLNT